MKKALLCLLLVVSAVTFAHKPLLPKPQQITYGSGRLMLKELSIGFLSKASAEDQFAALQLASFLGARTGSKISVNGNASATILFKRTGASDPLAVPGEKTGAGSRESYQIQIGKKNISITAPSSAGLFYAVQTLRQMIEGNGANAWLPEATVEDWPSLAYRGFMMDMSHMQFPKVAEIKEQIDFLSRFKTNQYFFYSEASIELKGYPLLMANARYTAEEIRDIIEFAKKRHVDVIPNMELYGHLHDLFKLEHYADLSVNPYGGEFKPRDARVKTIVGDWIKQISALFPSRFFHIGFDETWVIDLEAKKLNITPDELYLDMLNQTTELVEKEGKHALVWADMLQKYHSIIPKISKRSTAVAWHYFPLRETQYDSLLSPFASSSIPLTVQAASINWHWFYPAFDVSFQNNELLLKAGRKYNAVGYINSGWTDDPLTLLRLARPDMAHGSASSWQTQPVDRNTFFDDYAQVLYPEAQDSIAPHAYNLLAQGESKIRAAVGYTDGAIWDDPFSERSLKMYEANKENLHQGRLLIEKAQIYLRQALKSNVDSSTFFSMLTAARMLDMVAMKYLFAGDIADVYRKYSKQRDATEFRMMMGEITAYYHSKTVDMFDIIVETKEMFQKSWLNEYTSFRLGIPLAKFDLELQYWMKLQKKLDLLKTQYKPNESFPPLQEFLNKNE